MLTGMEALKEPAANYDQFAARDGKGVVSVSDTGGGHRDKIDQILTPSLRPG